MKITLTSPILVLVIFISVIKSFGNSKNPSPFGEVLLIYPDEYFKILDHDNQRKSFEIGFQWLGMYELEDYDLKVTSIDGLNYTIQGDSILQPNEVYMFSLHGIKEGSYRINATLTIRSSIRYDYDNFELIVSPPVLNFARSDINLNYYNLLTELHGGKTTILFFFSSQDSTSKKTAQMLNNIWKNQSHDANGFQVFGIGIRPEDNISQIKNLDWNLDFPLYPLIFDFKRIRDFYHSIYLTGELCPYLVMICPNQTDPAYSSIMYSESNLSQVSEVSILQELDLCPKPEIRFIEEEIFLDTSTIFNTYRFNFSLKNMGDTIGQVYWLFDGTEAILDSNTGQWEFMVTDNNTCWFPEITMSPDNWPNNIDTNEIKNWDILLRHFDYPGNATVYLQLYYDPSFLYLVDELAFHINLKETTRLYEPSIEDITVYPNPAKSFLSVEFPGQLDGQLEIAIFDSEGNQMDSKTARSIQVDKQQLIIGTSLFPTGNYYLLLQTSNKYLIQKFIKL